MTHFHEKSCNKNKNSCGLCCTKIKNLEVAYGETKILDNIDIHIHCGELTAIVGPNGAGKSTLLKALLGETKHSGKMEFTDNKGLHTGHPIIGYVPQSLDFDKTSPISVLDVFTACLTNNPIWIFKQKEIRLKTEDSLKIVQGEHLINKKLGTLSGGELQRVMLALALVPQPDLLLLDEPVSGIDQKGLELFYDIVCELRKNFDMSIILVSHDFNLVAKHADRVILLNKSVQAVGTPEEVLTAECLSKAFGQIWFKNPEPKQTEEG